MVERFKAYFERLKRLSSEDLDRSAERLVRCEKRDVALLIAHLAEISRRKVELERGYKNLFDYGVRRLNLSEGSVALRLQVANVPRRFPQILVTLADNRVSLTVAGLLAPHLSEENVEKLLSDCAGMTKRAVEEYLVSIRPKPVFTPSIRKQPSPAGNREAFRSQSPPASAAPSEPAPPLPSFSSHRESLSEAHLRFSLPRDRISSTSASPPTGGSRRSSRGWRKCSGSRIRWCVWPRSWSTPWTLRWTRKTRSGGESVG